ncbi:MAG: multicopper oxidase domain-containing protein [Candidatus Anammoxibacter sp.]
MMIKKTKNRFFVMLGAAILTLGFLGSAAQAQLVVKGYLPFPPPIGVSPKNDITRPPSDIPAKPLADNAKVTFTAHELHAPIAPGPDNIWDTDDDICFRYFAFGGGQTEITEPKVPGPFIRIKEGNTVTIELKNDKGNEEAHSIDFHAVLGARGGAAVLVVAPGGSKEFTFKAERPGLYVYHCVGGGIPHDVARHMNNGMYGMILVEPKDGPFKNYLNNARFEAIENKTKVKEFYIFESEMYLTDEESGEEELTKHIGAPKVLSNKNVLTCCNKGINVYSLDKVLKEEPTYAVYNGRVGGLFSHPLVADVGDTAILYYGMNGQSPASFHIIGGIFDKVWHEGDLMAEPSCDLQTTQIPCAGVTVIGMNIVPEYAEYPFPAVKAGLMVLVDHRIPSLEKGAVGAFVIP